MKYFKVPNWDTFVEESEDRADFLDSLSELLADLMFEKKSLLADPGWKNLKDHLSEVLEEALTVRGKVNRSLSAPGSEVGAETKYVLESTIGKVIEAINELCPPYVYFGQRSSSGMAFFIDRDQLSQDMYDGLILLLSSGDEWPQGKLDDKPYIEFVLETNDHGNMTLLDREQEVVWSIV